MGRIIVLSFLFATGVMGFAVYRTFKDSPTVKNSVANQLHLQMQSFLATLPVEQQSRFEFEVVEKTEVLGGNSVPVIYRFFLSPKEAWSLELQDKAIAITAPSIRAEAQLSTRLTTSLREKDKAELAVLTEKARVQILDKARVKTGSFLQKWLEVQFPKEKGIELKIRFANEPAKDSTVK